MAKRIVTIAELAEVVHDYGAYLQREFGPEPAEASDDICQDIRLQIHEDDWSTHTGDSQYDQDHRGVWGSAYVPRGVSKAGARNIARDLIDEAGD